MCTAEKQRAGHRATGKGDGGMCLRRGEKEIKGYTDTSSNCVHNILFLRSTCMVAYVVILKK